MTERDKKNDEWIKKKKRKRKKQAGIQMGQCVTTANNSSQERQVKACHYKMGVVMQVMIQGPSAKQSKPHSQCVTRSMEKDCTVLSPNF